MDPLAEVKIASYLDVKVPFQGSREEENGLMGSKKSKGKTNNRNKIVSGDGQAGGGIPRALCCPAAG
ncbi:hypothetical protein J8J21_22805, partial [Mycobacterium tuberculosis]